MNERQPLERLPDAGKRLFEGRVGFRLTSEAAEDAAAEPQALREVGKERLGPCFGQPPP